MMPDKLLPIDVVPGIYPLTFRWSQTVTTPDGRIHVQDQYGGLPASVESAINALIVLTKKLQAEVKELKKTQTAQPSVGSITNTPAVKKK
jgi:hypothetical protein